MVNFFIMSQVKAQGQRKVTQLRTEGKQFADWCDLSYTSGAVMNENGTLVE
jgi:hypothetical protein